MVAKRFDEEAIFKVAAGIPAQDIRRDYLQQVCGGDEALLGRLQTLLRAHDEAPSFLEPLASEFAATIDFPPITECPGTQIGPYKLIQEMGEGGFGVVYMAEQKEPMHRQVALKIIKPGMDTREVIARFRGRTPSPGHDGPSEHRPSARRGSDRSGRPYFVMELVQGIADTPITATSTAQLIGFGFGQPHVRSQVNLAAFQVIRATLDHQSRATRLPPSRCTIASSSRCLATGAAVSVSRSRDSVSMAFGRCVGPVRLGCVHAASVRPGWHASSRSRSDRSSRTTASYSRRRSSPSASAMFRRALDKLRVQLRQLPPQVVHVDRLGAFLHLAGQDGTQPFHRLGIAEPSLRWHPDTASSSSAWPVAFRSHVPLLGVAVATIPDRTRSVDAVHRTATLATLARCP